MYTAWPQHFASRLGLGTGATGWATAKNEPRDKTNQCTEGPEDESTGHRGFNGAVVRIGREPADHEVTHERDDQVAADGPKESNAESLHRCVWPNERRCCYCAGAGKKACCSGEPGIDDNSDSQGSEECRQT